MAKREPARSACLSACYILAYNASCLVISPNVTGNVAFGEEDQSMFSHLRYTCLIAMGAGLFCLGVQSARTFADDNADSGKRWAQTVDRGIRYLRGTQGDDG